MSDSLGDQKTAAVALKREMERCYGEKARPGAASPIQAPVSFKYQMVAMLKKRISSLVCKQL